MSRCMFNTPFCPPSSHTHNTEMIKKTEGRKRGSKGGRNEGSREEGALAIHLILWYIIIWHKYNWNKNTLTSAHCHCDVIAQSPGLPEVVRINAIHLYEGRERKKEEQLSNCQRSRLTAVDEERGRKANRLLESTGTVGWSVEKESEAVSRRYSTGLKHADKFDELGRKE